MICAQTWNILPNGSSLHWRRQTGRVDGAENLIKNKLDIEIKIAARGPKLILFGSTLI
jgi:hypothetical protein